MTRSHVQTLNMHRLSRRDRARRQSLLGTASHGRSRRSLVYIKARRERGQRAFTGVEVAIAVVIAALAVLAAWLMWIGRISPI